ncbi:MAG: hypothetical protein HY263_08345 [Chloroflexi bacterium]|nr:hypothetical protein [Chloroflexota bacterium]
MGQLLRSGYLRSAFLAAATGIVLVAAAILLWPQGGSQRHFDGAGPLGSEGGDVRVTMAFPADMPGPWSLGIPVCLFSGSDPATIESVGPTATLGSGSRYLGAGIRSFFRRSGDVPIISKPGFPPDVPDPVSPAVGAQVTTSCAAMEDPGAPYTELLVGFDATGGSGAGWSGVDIGYTVRGEHRILQVNETIARCGPSLDPGVCPTPPAAPLTTP